jgi:hypothetical protein
MNDWATDFVEREVTAGVRPSSVPERLCEICRDLMGASGASLLLVSDRGIPGVLASTDAISTRLADFQITLGEGPSLDAVTLARPIVVRDLTTTVSGWAFFPEAALHDGVQAIYAAPLVGGSRTLRRTHLLLRPPDRA